MIAKVIAHLITCIALFGYLKLEFELAGSKLWFIYVSVAIFVWVLNVVVDK